MLNCSCNCTCQNDMPSRRELMDIINHSSFAVFEMLLYLDTHPDDMDAMAFFQKQSCIRREAMRQYSQFYGPLTMDLVDDTRSDSWEWMMQPWPWEIRQKGRC